MEVLRSFLETESELKYFDKRVNPCKLKAFVAIMNMKGQWGSSWSYFLWWSTIKSLYLFHFPAVCPSSSSSKETKTAPRSVSLTSRVKPTKYNIKTYIVRRHSDSDSTSAPSSLIKGTASKSMSRTQSESGDQGAICYSKAPFPLSVVDQTKYRLRKTDVCNSPHQSPKTGPISFHLKWTALVPAVVPLVVQVL